MRKLQSDTARLKKVQEVLGRLETAGTMTANKDGSAHDVRTVSITPSEGNALSKWIVQEGATQTLEVGLAYGYSALHVCVGLLRTNSAQVRHTVMDPFQSTRFANCGLQVLEEAEVRDLVEYYPKISQTQLPKFVEEQRTFDFAFVDGNHRFDSVFLDLFYLGRLVRKGGVVMLDDYDLPGIEKVVTFFCSNLNWRIEEISTKMDKHTWVVLRTPLEDDGRDFRYFVDF